jgi:hypothetical protein
MPRLNLVWPEDGLDHDVAARVELTAGLGREHGPHQRVDPALPARSSAPALLGVGRDQDGKPACVQEFDLIGVPVPGVGEHNFRSVGHAYCRQLSLCCDDHRLELAKVG